MQSSSKVRGAISFTPKPIKGKGLSKEEQAKLQRLFDDGDRFAAYQRKLGKPGY